MRLRYTHNDAGRGGGGVYDIPISMRVILSV